MNVSTSFLNKKVRYSRMLKEINDVTKSPQTEGHTLADLFDSLGALMDAVQDNVKCMDLISSEVDLAPRILILF